MWGVKLVHNSATGKQEVAGVGLNLTSGAAPQSEFIVRANRFTVLNNTGGAPVSPFTIAADGKTIIRSALIGDASITNAKIANAAITAAKIKDAEITSAKIENAAITTAKIENAAITSAKIGDAEVSTLKIEGNAVTVPLASHTAGSIDVGSAGAVVQTINPPISLGFTTITMSFSYSFLSYGATQQVLLDVLKNGVIVRSGIEVHFIDFQEIGVYTGQSGTHSHTVTGSASGGSVSGSTGFAGSHTHFVSGVGSIGSAGSHTHNFSGSVSSSPVSATAGSGGNHSHAVFVQAKTRSAGTASLAISDATGANGVYSMRVRATQGGAVRVSNRSMIALTARR